MAPTTVRQALDTGMDRLTARTDSARLDCELLLCAELDRPRAWLHAHGEDVLETATIERYYAAVAQRAQGVPLAHLTGRREFWSLELAITPDTLVPRPDTETLVAAALEVAAEAPPAHAADLGTGSGAVALALASEWPGTQFIATEVSEPALEVARRNAARLGIDRIEFRLQTQSLAKIAKDTKSQIELDSWRSLRALREELKDWCSTMGQDRFGVIVSNPPYVAEGDPHLDMPEIRHEPRGALAAGPDGLDALRAIATCAPAHLEPGGWLLLEHGFDQADVVTGLLKDAGLHDIRSWRDLAGHARVTGGRVSR